MSLLLLLELLLVVLGQVCGEFLALLVLSEDLLKVDFEFAEELVDGSLVFFLDLLDLLFISLLHLEAFLL